MARQALAVWVIVVLVCCLLPASERVELDRRVGQAEAGGVTIEVHDGLAGVRAFDGKVLELWAQAPAFALEVSAPSVQAAALRVDIHNCMRDARLTSGSTTLVPVQVGERLASCRFQLPEGPSGTWRYGPLDAGTAEPFSFAVLSDIQRAVNKVDDIFARMNEDPTLRFVVSTGDLVNTGMRSELRDFQRRMQTLRIPLFSTVGNHEMGAEPRHWHELFGPFNTHFAFKGVRFSLVDSGNATIDPDVYDWLDDWLSEARDEVHVLLTHYPPLDPVGLRGGGFRSRKEGAKLMQRLGEGRVDALFLGHIHSYYAFSLAGVPAYVSGGGGAIEEQLDGIGRHYLKVQAQPGKRLDDISIVRVD